MASRGMKVTFSAPAALPSHVALCIGNSKYASSPLANAAHDAQDVAALCAKLGFATEVLLEASLEQMLAAVEAFVAKLSRGGVSLFFYAGAQRRWVPRRRAKVGLRGRLRKRQGL
jgi:uncharacterized caspase-like protein